MATKFALPAASFASTFTTASNLDPGFLAFSTGLSETQFRIEEDTKDYASAVEQSSLLIGLDVQRLIAVDVAGIQIQVAKDKALYKSALADSVKAVKVQEAHLEGGFGIDVALVKSAVDLESTAVTAALQEESTTMLAEATSASVITLAGEEEYSAGYILEKERVFRMSMADTDYAASVALADTRGASIRARGLLDKTTIVKESGITDTGLSTAYTLESDGYSAMATVETAYIKSSGSAEVSHMTEISGVKIANIRSLGGLETTHIAKDASIKVQHLTAETNAQISSGVSLSNLETTHINTAGGLEVNLITLTAASEDSAYLAGAAADIAIDIAKHVAEADGIKAIAAASLELITIKANADKDAKIAVAKIQGQVDIDKAVASNSSDHAVAVERGKHAKNLSTLRVDAIGAIANIRASQTSDLSAIVVKQLQDDSNQAATFTQRSRDLDITKMTNMTTVEGEAAMIKSTKHVAHVSAMAGLSTEYLQAQSQASIDAAAAASTQATVQMGLRLTEEQDYIAKSNAAAAEVITEIGATSLDYIVSETEIQNQRIRLDAGIQYNASVAKADIDYEYTTQTSAVIEGITTTMATWEERARTESAAWESRWQQATANLKKYSEAYHNVFTGDGAAGPLIDGGTDTITYDLPSEPGLPAPVSN